MIMISGVVVMAALAVFFLWNGVDLAGLLTGERGVVASEQKESKPDNVKPKDAAQKDDKDMGPMALINKRQKELDQREEELNASEKRLLAIKNDIDIRIIELNKVHSRINEFLKKIDDANDLRNKKIVRIYESMSPEDAAARLEKLDEKMAIMILASMNEKKAAKILSFVEVGKAAKLSEALKIKNE